VKVRRRLDEIKRGNMATSSIMIISTYLYKMARARARVRVLVYP